uniref:response regulator transcription factor n=1 Tax=Flavobacterium sp. TaxID=239 RepID=UPI00404916AA
MIKLALVDDHQLVRKSMSFLIDNFQNMEVVYESDNGYDFIDFAKKQTIDVLLLDLQMPIVSGFEVCKRLKEQNSSVKILIISQLTSKEAIHHVMECGANGYFSKNSSPELLEDAIHRVVNEGYCFDISMSATIREAIMWDTKTHFSFGLNQEIELSSREIAIIKMACQEKSSQEIGELLNITARTVETHRTRMIKKISVKNFIGVILYAIKSEAIQIEDI